MIKLHPPVFDDATALSNIAADTDLGSFPNLQSAVVPITAGYAQYKASRGNPYLVNPVGVSNVQATHLKKHYKSPPNEIKFITQQRDETSPYVCSMCGSLLSGTLDHFLPKNTFPEFSIFSLNLVPACKCNSKRGEVLFGFKPGERLLHPYFDGCLADRLVVAKIQDPGPLPLITVMPLVTPGMKYRSAILFHFSSIVEKSYVTKYLFKKWTTLCRKPSLEVRSLKRPVKSLKRLKSLLEDELSSVDDQHESKNNWNSIFITGLLDPAVMSWLFGRLNDPSRPADGPLI